MGLLGEFLESFYGSGQAFKTVRAHVRCERTPIGHGKTSRRRTIGREKISAAKSDSSEDLNFWAVLPDRVRVDATKIKNGRSVSTVEISRGSERLKRTADGSVEVESEPRRGRGDGDLLPTEYRRHFDRSLIRHFFASLVLEQLGESTIAGRACVRIRALPVPGDRIWPHWLPPEADEFEFAADLEFPSLLSIKGLLSRTTIESLEVIDVTFNESIDDSVFTCEPSSGQSVRKAVPITQPISLEAAPTKVPFKVLLPKIDTGEGSPQLHYEPLLPDGSGENLTVFYHGTGSNSLWFTLRQQPDPELEDGLEWEEVEISGRRFKLSDPQCDDGTMVLKFCQDGTWVEVFSDHSRNDLLAIAMSFEAVD